MNWPVVLDEVSAAALITANRPALVKPDRAIMKNSRRLDVWMSLNNSRNKIMKLLLRRIHTTFVFVDDFLCIRQSGAVT
jgi:hypothetical protein